eukprot:2837462-Rhodomonas_salina.1
MVSSLNIDVLNDDKRLEAASQDFRYKFWSNFHPHKLLPSLKSAAQVKWNDTDLTTDFRGTLHAPKLSSALVKSGRTIAKHQCGRNMVRATCFSSTCKGRKRGASDVVETTLKAYNKVWETMTSVKAKSNERKRGTPGLGNRPLL